MRAIPLEGETNHGFRQIGRFVGLFRPWTRLWYDVIAPATMVLLVAGLEASRSALWSVVGAVLLFHAGHTLFNDVVDEAADRSSSESSRNQRAFVRGHFSKRFFMVGGWLLVLSSLIPLVRLPLSSILFFFIGLPLLLAYNFPPLKLSGRPLAGLLFWPLTWTVMYGFCASAVGLADWRHGIPYLCFVILFMGIGEGLAQDIRDADNDAAGGRVTTVVRYGVGASSWLAWAGFAASTLAWVALVVQDLIPLAFSLVAGGVLVAWLVHSLRAVLRLQRDYNKADGRLLHTGSIATFSVINVIVILGVLARAS